METGPSSTLSSVASPAAESKASPASFKTCLLRSVACWRRSAATTGKAARFAARCRCASRARDQAVVARTVHDATAGAFHRARPEAVARNLTLVTDPRQTLRNVMALVLATLPARQITIRRGEALQRAVGAAGLGATHHVVTLRGARVTALGPALVQAMAGLMTAVAVAANDTLVTTGALAVRTRRATALRIAIQHGRAPKQQSQ